VFIIFNTGQAPGGPAYARGVAAGKPAKRMISGRCSPCEGSCGAAPDPVEVWS